MERRGANWNEADDKALLEMVKAGKSWSIIGIRMKRTSIQVRRRYNKLIPPPRRAKPSA